jgi:hypothetical protein
LTPLHARVFCLDARGVSLRGGRGTHLPSIGLQGTGVQGGDVYIFLFIFDAAVTLVYFANINVFLREI